MNKPPLTKDQENAVFHTGGALLVSAAAGSGKTMVLVEHILKILCDPGSSINIDDFLIITYTNAAASELRGKIIDAIYARLAEEPENRRLRRQADRCSMASIGTIHSFCASLIRENAHEIGISPAFRIIDESESRLIQEEVLRDLLEESYAEGRADFIALADSMGAGRDDSALETIILETYTKLMSHPYPEKWVEEQLSAFEKAQTEDPAQAIWGRTILKKAESVALYAMEEILRLIDEGTVHDKWGAAYGPSLETTRDGLHNLLTSIRGGRWDDVYAAVNVPFPRPKPLSGFDELKKARNAVKDTLSGLTVLVSEPAEQVAEDLCAVFPEVKGLLELVLQFRDRYAALKRKRAVLDFSDQEHFALDLLLDPETETPSALARSASQRYKEILVDEYQDVNGIQEMIFSAVSREGKNLFMVGDVKQSIYRFRLADPTIFLEKYRRFKPFTDAREDEPRKVLLSQNFRSRKGVLDAVNYVFTYTMSQELGEMDYTQEEALYFGATYYPDSDEPTVELDVLDLKDASEEDENLDRVSAEAAFAAKRIRELVGRMQVYDGKSGFRPLQYGDIAILMRSPRSRIDTWLAALAERDIPTSVELDNDFFKTPEIAIAMALSAVIDNPRQDIPLISVLRSPMFGFSSDELGEIRGMDKSGDFYAALRKAAETNEKCGRFIEELNRFRKKAPDMPAYELLWQAFSELGFFAAVSAMPGGYHRHSNLMLFLETAKKVDAAGYKGLFGFNLYMQKLMEDGDSPVSSAKGQSGNAVTIMSIHKSKGLEFPVVILADLTHQFNKEDATKSLLIHEELGIGPKRKDLIRRIEYPTIARKAVKLQIMQETLSEELRVLYVAMTRAKEKLVMLCSYKDAEREVLSLAGCPLPVPPERMAAGRSCADWLLMAALRRPEAEKILFGVPNVPVEDGGAAWDVHLVRDFSFLDTYEPETQVVWHPVFEDMSAVDSLRKSLSWQYPWNRAISIPTKLTATELKGSFMQTEAKEDADELVAVPVHLTPPSRPALLSDIIPLTPAEKGTATHLVMQYADYARCCTLEGVKKEIERLRLIRNLTDEEAAAVNPKNILAFFRSELGNRLVHAQRVWRELKFSILAPSDRFPGFAEGESLLLQGVVDCCFEEDGFLTIIDFKTDHVRTHEQALERAETYRGQLSAYRIAMERMLEMPVKECKLYFLSANEEVGF